MNLKNLLVILLICVSASCAKIKISDQEYCGDIGEFGATCFHTLTEETRDIEKGAWDRERFGMICSTAETFGEMKKVVLKLCSLSKRCSKKAKKKINKFGNNLEVISEMIRELEPP